MNLRSHECSLVRGALVIFLVMGRTLCVLLFAAATTQHKGVQRVRAAWSYP